MESQETRKVDLDLIDPDPNQPRKNKPIEYLRELGSSIKEKGLRNAIHIRENPDVPGRFLIINGECRWTASVLVGLKEIDAKIFEYAGDNVEGEVFVDQLMDNGVRKNLDPLEELQAYQRAIDMGMKAEDIARAYGKSVELIEKDLPILRMPEIMLKEYDNGNIPKAVARAIAVLPNHKRMIKAWEWAKNGKNVDGMLKKIDAYVARSNQQTFDIFDQAISEADGDEKKAARIAAEKLMQAIISFKETPFANGKGELMLVVNSRRLGEIEQTAKEMAAIARKIMDDIGQYKARSKSAAV
jgi:ParB family chromosome partitioning protein